MALYTCTKDIKIYIKQNNFTPMGQYTMYKRHEQNNFTPMVQYTMYKRHEQNNFTMYTKTGHDIWWTPVYANKHK
jgi:hypothetical protein